MCSAERSGGYFYTMCQTPMRRRELRPSPPSMAMVRTDPALLQDPLQHKGPWQQRVPVPHPSGALLGQSHPTGHTGPRGCRGPAAAEKGVQTGTTMHEPMLHMCMLPLFIPHTLLPSSRGKAQEVPRELRDVYPILCVPSGNSPPWHGAARGWQAVPQCPENRA